MAELLEIIMLICFGISWPINLIKNYKAGTAKSTSLLFLLCIEAGYVAGISAKLVSGTFKWYVLFFYILNLVVVTMNLVVYFRNRQLDMKNQKD